MKHKLFTTLLVMLMSMTGVNAFAQDSNYYDISRTNDDGVTLYYKYINNGEELEVVYPGEESDFNYWDYNNYYTQETIRIPSEIKFGYWSWETTTIPVTSIGSNCFRACENLTSIYIPSSITNIGEKVFYECSKLENIEIEDGNEKYDSRDNCNAIIETTTNTLIIGCKNTTIPSYSVEKIGKDAFIECTGLSSITIPYGVNEICDSAFYRCENLETVDVASSVRTIGEGAFAYCEELSSLSLSWGLQEIKFAAFESCKALNSVTLPNSLTTLSAQSFPRTGLTSFYLPMNVQIVPKEYQTLGTSIFVYNPINQSLKIENIQVSPDNPYYETIDGNKGIVEKNTKKLLSVAPKANYINVPGSVKEIASGVFVGAFDSIVINEGVERIKIGAFGSCTVGKIKFPSTIREAFHIMFMNGTDTIEINDIRTWCEYFEEVSESPYNFFAVNGKTVHDLVIPQGTTKVCSRSFGGSNIKNIFIPSSVELIGKNAFSCDGLSSVYVEWVEPLSLSNEICRTPANVTLYVPRGCKAAYQAADYWKDFKEIKEYGDGNATFTMNSSNISTYSNGSDLDFTSVEGLKAYIASGFKPSTGELTMTRVYEVPAGEGLLLKGAAGDYEIPYTETDMYYSNLLVGVPTATTVNPTEGDYTNFILSNGANGIGFYTLSAAGEIGPNKAYLQLPTSVLPATANSRQIKLLFDDEEEITGIESLTPSPSPKGEGSGYYYALDGRKLMQKPAKAGLYVKDGKKVFVK